MKTRNPGERASVYNKPLPPHPYNERISNAMLRRIVKETTGNERQSALNYLHIKGQIDPCGKPFTWGTVIRWHEAGPYKIAEYKYDEPCWYKGVLESPAVRNSRYPGNKFHGYVKSSGTGWRDSGHSHHSLDEALVWAVAYRAEENPNSQAAVYFMRMIGDCCEEEGG